MMGTCLSDLALDRIAAGVPAASEHLAGCRSCALRLAAVVAAKESTAARPLPWESAQVSTAKTSPEPTAARSRRTWVAPSLALAASLALAVGISGRGLPVGDDGRADDSVRTKGAIGRLSIAVLRPGTTATAWDGEALHPGDVVQWVVGLGAPRWVIIVGRDGAGAVGVYYPEGATSARVEAGAAVALDRSLTLDAVPGNEALTVFFCERERPVADAIAAVARDRDDATLGGCEVQRLVLRKVAP